MQLVLSLFPGADLLGKAFENQGMCIVRGPDKLWGGDIREFHGVPGKFDGVIGGPPCQMFSKAAISGSPAENLIPEFLRLIDETKPRWAVMENVPQARWAAPKWPSVTFRDWDVGGLTFRTRTFWFYGIEPAPAPSRLPGEPEYSVLASNWQTRGDSSHIKRYTAVTGAEAGRLQGYPELAQRIVDNQPGGLQANGKWRGVSWFSRNVLAVHMMGNGVPRAMAAYIASHVARQLDGRESWDLTGLPLFMNSSQR